MRVVSSSVGVNALVVAGVFGLLGCLGEPIPKQVRAGSTFFLSLGGLATQLGFGAQAGTQGSDALLGSDPQRGDVRFALCTNPSCTPELPLVTRYLSRVYPDPASPAARSGQLTVSGVPALGAIRGQPIVILDVPLSTPAGTYTLRYFKSAAALPAANSALETIEIVAGTSEQFSDITTEQGLGFDVSQSLRDLIPDPVLQLDLVNPNTDRPAAASVVVSHPPQVLVEGAFENGNAGQGSIVRVAPGPSPNTVALSFIDPDQLTPGLALTFTLMDPQLPVLSTDFSIISQVLYDANGLELPLAAEPEDPGNRFTIPGTEVLAIR